MINQIMLSDLSDKVTPILAYLSAKFPVEKRNGVFIAKEHFPKGLKVNLPEENGFYKVGVKRINGTVRYLFLEKENNSLQITPEISEMLQRYTAFAKAVRKPQLAEDARKRLLKILSAKFTNSSLCQFLFILTAMQNEYTAIDYRPNYKELATATKILGKADSETLLKLIPFFVSNYQFFAVKGWEETNIFTLNYQFNTIKSKL